MVVQLWELNKVPKLNHILLYSIHAKILSSGHTQLELSPKILPQILCHLLLNFNLAFNQIWCYKFNGCSIGWHSISTDNVYPEFGRLFL